MYIDDFLWLSAIVDKLVVKHRVTQDEVEEALLRRFLAKILPPRFPSPSTGEGEGGGERAA